jgi:hypothetical protein
MIRRVTIRLISLLLVANGVAGILAVWVGWSMTAELLTTLRQTSTSVAAQQARLVESVRGVAAAVDDSAQATTGVSRSSARARVAVTDATRTADDLAATFDRLAEGSRVTVFGVRPLAEMTQPFEANAEDFRRISVSLGEMSASLEDNAREMARVGDDLRSINSQLNITAANIEALPSASLLAEGLATLELGTRLFLALILFEAALSALTGLALVMTTVQPRAHPVDRLVVRPEHAEATSPLDPRVPSPPTPPPEGERSQAPSPSGRGRLG